MVPPMAVSAGGKSLAKQRTALSLYQLMALRAEVEGLRSEVGRRREEGEFKIKCESQSESINLRRHQAEAQHAFSLIRKRRMVSEPQTIVSQSCLQLLANDKRETYRKEFDLEPHTGIPWQTGLERGSSLKQDGDTMVVQEEGFYFVYSQLARFTKVYYMDRTFAMGHVVIRRKRNVVGDEPQFVVLFRCIQSMNDTHPYNTCYTGGVVKLEVGDHLELLIPRSTANVSLDGDATFMGAFKLV
ncbi:tumor necrosis factor ligand superfamily member 13B isoform X5 [Cynoglossus semilaevis]|uniref:tumor necrosis factor ligand superfamily member 13B isoform X5 n=1 Tax=Cynoglossus semilaevis TaxID=244447 RepID=UPI0007DCA8C1|nr:tumor necrosis factor ligand superfamily member 13B isoform X5 [Cynoglossus semilaevis]